MRYLLIFAVLVVLCGCDSQTTVDLVKQNNFLQSELTDCRMSKTAERVVNLNLPPIMSMTADGQSVNNSIFIYKNLTNEQMDELKSYVEKTLMGHDWTKEPK